jgi:hypothetical protein
MRTYAIQTPAGVVHVDAEEWQVDDSGCLGLFSAGVMVRNWWRDEWIGDAPGEAAAEPVNDNAPADPATPAA